jgi:hypothetical protein
MEAFAVYLFFFKENSFLLVCFGSTALLWKHCMAPCDILGERCVMQTTCIKQMIVLGVRAMLLGMRVAFGLNA